MARTWLLMLISLLVLPVLACGGSDGGDGEPFALARSELVRVSEPDVPSSDAEALRAGNAAFTWDLYHILAREDGNLFFSPHSISTALAMTYAGARGQTATEMAAILHFDLPEDRLHAAFNGLDQALAKRSEVELDGDAEGDAPELHIANTTWGEKEYTFLPEYLDVLALNYGAGMHLLDFVGEPEGSRATINDWVEEQTQDRIKDLIPEGAIDTNTRLVLTNAIYFKASWLLPFAESRTAPAPFTLLDSSTVDVDMMQVTGAVALHAQGDGWQAVEFPYIGEEVAMLVILPDDGDFAEIEASLNAATYDAVVSSLQPVTADVAMPKFTFEWDSSLSDPLIEMGMPTAFSGAADFSGMDGTRNLAISDVIHKSFIAVDETGTEAAAATAVIMRETSGGPTVDFTIDRPFIFIIRDRPTGAILFAGRYVGP